MYRRADPDKPEVVDPSDIPVSAEEAIAIAQIASAWPPGLGEVLIPDATRRRGWKRDPEFGVFKTGYVPPAGAKLCPVMELKRLRGWRNEYRLHLSAWRSLRNAYARVLGVDLKTARQRYNEDLRTNPTAMQEIFERYASLHDTA